jgi:hypothetical protein
MRSELDFEMTANSVRGGPLDLLMASMYRGRGVVVRA